MPTYVYECPHCKRVKEIIHSVKELEERTVVCEACIPKKHGCFKMKRIVAPTSFILKGQGWAKDGYDKT